MNAKELMRNAEGSSQLTLINTTTTTN